MAVFVRRGAAKQARAGQAERAEAGAANEGKLTCVFKAFVSPEVFSENVCRIVLTNSIMCV